MSPVWATRLFFSRSNKLQLFDNEPESPCINKYRVIIIASPILFSWCGVWILLSWGGVVNAGILNIHNGLFLDRAKSKKISEILRCLRRASNSTLATVIMNSLVMVFRKMVRRVVRIFPKKVTTCWVLIGDKLSITSDIKKKDSWNNSPNEGSDMLYLAQVCKYWGWEC